MACFYCFTVSLSCFTVSLSCYLSKIDIRIVGMDCRGVDTKPWRTSFSITVLIDFTSNARISFHAGVP